MLDRRPEEFLTGKLEDNENFKCTPEYKTWLACQAGRFDITKSDYVREAVSFYSTLLTLSPRVRDLSLEGLRADPEFVRNILVLLEKV